ncbi:MAG: GNVR domain-containing protein, partial [Acidobacteriota bacterium]
QEQIAGVKKLIEAMDKEMSGNKIPMVLPEMEVHGRAVTVFKNKVAQLQIQLNEMKAQYTADFVPMKQAEEELKLTVQSLREELARSLQAQKVLAASLDAKLGEQDRLIAMLRERIRSTAEEKSAYERIKQEYALSKDAYMGVSNQLEQARLANSVQQEKQYVTLMDPPDVPSKPYKPNRLLLVLLGLFSGILMGFGTAVMIDYFDHTIKKPQDVERFLGLDLIGSIVKLK